MKQLQRIATLLGRWPVALATVLVMASLVLMPGLGASGLWEPQERALADKVAPPKAVEEEQAAKDKANPPSPLPPPEDCQRMPPKDATARGLTNAAIVFGRDTFSDSDAGRRLPFALMGLLTALATAAIALRLGTARSAVIAGLVVLSMPLLVMQSRMLTSEIGTACGGTLLVYALVALARLGSAYGTALAAVDAAVSAAALALGAWLGFRGGGALLGLVVPIGAVAAAGGLGAGLVKKDRPMTALPALFATIAAVSLLAIIVHQIYTLKAVTPGMYPPPRVIAGKALVSEGCWSSALGGTWRPDEDLRMIFDSMFEQIAYGTFPWGVLAPIAMIALLYSGDKDKRTAGAVTLAWAALAWIACEVFQRKVGFTLYAGFPALAIAVGVWVDDVLTRRVAGAVLPAGLILLGLFFAVGVLDLAKDLQGFADHISSLLIGGDQLPYPKDSKLFFIPTKLWIVLLGLLPGLGFGLTLMLWPRVKRLAGWGLVVAFAGTVVLGAFWAFAWQPRLAINVSSKGIFEEYKAAAKPGDELVIMGDLGQAPRAYAPDVKATQVGGRAEVVTALSKPARVFAIAPQSELCSLHRELSGKPYYVLEDRNARNLLLSNKLDDDATDKNPLATAILHKEPTQMTEKPKGKVVWDGKIQLLGWDVPATMSRGSKVEVRVYYKILSPVGGAWTALMHFDGALRFNGDHKPINDRCPTSTWQPGDFIVDTYTVTAGGGAFPAGKYDLFIGFFTGSAPNWKNMTVSDVPNEMRDQADRVKLMSVTLE